MDKKAVILFVKFPAEGSVKTRLADAVGKKSAKLLSESFILDTLDVLHTAHYDIIISYAPDDCKGKFISWLGEDFTYISQKGNDIGQKMQNALYDVFDSGYSKAVLIGSDLPELETDNIDSAFKILNNKNAVIGPAYDGGYYLIGFNKDSFNPDIFYDIHWSTNKVYYETVNKMKENNIKFKAVEKVIDIDTIDDLIKLYRTKRNYRKFKNKRSFDLIKRLAENYIS